MHLLYAASDRIDEFLVVYRTCLRRFEISILVPAQIGITICLLKGARSSPRTDANALLNYILRKTQRFDGQGDRVGSHFGNTGSVADLPDHARRPCQPRCRHRRHTNVHNRLAGIVA